jgi:hypothetical protein
MIVVIQCAAGKCPDAGRMVSRDGRPVEFVADPQAAPDDQSRVYARPDDAAYGGKSWRQLVRDYNYAHGSNPLGLYPAYQLYENSAYRRLVDRFGIQSVFILSAGWGLISADFLTPHYDITFSKNPKVPKFKRRNKSDQYDDFRLPPGHEDDHVVFLGGKDYLCQFCDLTAAIRGPRTVFYRSANPPPAPGCKLVKYETTTRTNWHYGCANAFLAGKIKV